MDQKHKIRFILNPFSGVRRNIDLKALINEHIDLSLIELEIVFTESAGHARILSKEAADNDYYAVIAAGGDGTINEVASSLIHTKTALGIIPLGSGNGFAYHMGIRRDIIKAIKLLNDAYKISIDTGSLNDQFFINVAGLGLDAKVAFLTKKNKKRGFFPYFVATMKESIHFQYMKLTITTAEKEETGDYAMIAVANGSMYGYDFSIAPDAKMNDGLFDVVLIRKAPIFRYFGTAVLMFLKSLHKSGVVQIIRCSDVKIKTEDAGYYHLDGEGFVAACDTFVFKVNPSSLYLLTK
ncbi:MAG: diacylglycerol kinase family protein [Saprospiraceae bacterium]|nr:diacylglycerol kinase family lipid kinase [Saprospiraceae bacterium]